MVVLGQLADSQDFADPSTGSYERFGDLGR